MIDRYNLSNEQLDLNKTIMTRFINRMGNQTDVAHHFNVSRQLVSNWKKTGKIPVYVAKVIANELHININKIRPDIFE